MHPILSDLCLPDKLLEINTPACLENVAVRIHHKVTLLLAYVSVKLTKVFGW